MTLSKKGPKMSMGRVPIEIFGVSKFFYRNFVKKNFRGRSRVVQIDRPDTTRPDTRIQGPDTTRIFLSCRVVSGLANLKRVVSKTDPKNGPKTDPKRIGSGPKRIQKRIQKGSGRFGSKTCRVQNGSIFWKRIQKGSNSKRVQNVSKTDPSKTRQNK